MQAYVDNLARTGRGPRAVNLYADALVTFFRVNGFKRERELEVERHYAPARYGKTEEYVPTREEAWAMADSWGRNEAVLGWSALFLTLDNLIPVWISYVQFTKRFLT